jgi:hypothetical protein
MTPAPWVVTSMNDQTLITDARGHYIAVLVMKIATLWHMDMGDLRGMVAAPRLLDALKESTRAMAALKTRYPKEVGLEIYIEHNQRLIEAIEQQEEEG